MSYVLLETFKDHEVKYVKTYKAEDFKSALNTFKMEFGGKICERLNKDAVVLKNNTAARQFTLIRYEGEPIDRESVYDYSVCYSMVTPSGMSYHATRMETSYPVLTNKDVKKLTNQLKEEIDNHETNIISYTIKEQRFVAWFCKGIEADNIIQPDCRTSLYYPKKS